VVPAGDRPGPAIRECLRRPRRLVHLAGIGGGAAGDRITARCVPARAAADRALALDESLGAAHATLAHIKFQYARDWTGAEREFARAIDLDPGYANAHHWHALCLLWRGRPAEALDEIERARALDPLSLVINANL
jgi:tetratricopeptide (TPR) repeat protein